MSLHRIARYAGRPLLMTQDAARELALRALRVSGGALQHPRLARQPGAFFAKLGIASLLRPQAMEDDDALIVVDGDPPPPKPRGYAPSYAGEPEAEGFGWSLVDGIACMDIEGALLDRGFCSISGEMFWGYDTIAQAMREAMAEPRVKGVFIRMNSPGGVVAGSLEALTADMRALRQTGNANGKPIFVYADCAASAAYWISAQADRIVAPAVGMVGSIGAVIVHEDWTGALDKAGVKVTPIQFGAKKTDGAWFKPLSDGALADLQAEIDAVGDRFIADVVAGRDFLSSGKLISTQASCFLAEHSEADRSGLKLGLVDEIASEEAAFAALKAHVAGGGAQAKAKQVSATRRAPAPAAAVEDQSGAQTESIMRKSKKARIDAVMSRTALTPEEKLEKIQQILDEEETSEAEAEEETDAAAEGEEEETVAEGEEEETAAEGEEEEVAAEGEEEEPTAKAALARAKAILALPEAKGREQLAHKLAFTAGMSVKTAKGLLAASPKASKLVGQVHEPQLGAATDAPAPRAAGVSADDAKASQFIRSCHEMATGKKVKS